MARTRKKLGEWRAPRGTVEVLLARDAGEGANTTAYLLLEGFYGLGTPRGVVPVDKGQLGLLASAIETAKTAPPPSTARELATWTARGRTVKAFLAPGTDVTARLELVSMLPAFPKGTVVIDRGQFRTVLSAIETVKATA